MSGTTVSAQRQVLGIPCPAWCALLEHDIHVIEKGLPDGAGAPTVATEPRGLNWYHSNVG